MAATVSPWGKPGAWALDAEEHEAELLQQKGQANSEPSGEPLADFPSLAAAAAAKPKKKKGQTLSLAEFTKPSQRTSEPRGLTTEDLFMLPTGPRQRSAEEMDRARLGGGFKSYGLNSRYGSNGDESSNSRWSSSRGSDDSRKQGGYGRDAGRESAPSRADETDNWALGKKSPVGGGFERRERGGFFDSQSKADESESWVSNKSFVPTEARRSGSNSGGFERRGSFDSLSRETSNGGGADADNWGKKREDSGGLRPRLNLQPRTLPVSNGKQEGVVTVAKPKGANPFGEARPREEVLAEKGQDWKEIDVKLESVKIKDAVIERDGSFGKRSFGIGNGNGRASLADAKTERSWRKSDSVDSRPQSAEKSEDGNEKSEDGNEKSEDGNAEEN